MKEVIYSKDGEAVSDFDAEEYAYKLVDLDRLHICNETVLNYIRVMIREGALDYKDVKFVYIDPQSGVATQILTDKDGRLNVWPRGFGDQNVDAISRLLSSYAKK